MEVAVHERSTGDVINKVGFELTIECPDTETGAAAGTDSATVALTVLGATVAQLDSATALPTEVAAQCGILELGTVTAGPASLAVGAAGGVAARVVLTIESPVTLLGPTDVAVAQHGR